MTVDDVQELQSLSPVMKEPITTSSAKYWRYIYLSLLTQTLEVNV